MRNSILISIIILFFGALTDSIQAQEDLDFELTAGVHIAYPPHAISRTNLKEANSIMDLHKFYKPAWVREFLSVEFSTIINDEVVKVTTKNDLVEGEQKELMLQSDFGSEIKVVINYIPENTLSNNEPKIFDFVFTIDPDDAASFIGGETALQKYLQEHVREKINKQDFKKHQLSAISFTINEEGIVEDVAVVESSKNKDVDELLLNAVNKMPCWTPASYANGTKVKQKMVLTVGDQNSCVINLLNIRKNLE